VQSSDHAWAVYSDGAGTVFALPLPPTTGLAAGESAAFVLSAVVVNTAEGTATIDIAADVVGSPVTGRVDVRKDRPAHVGDSQPGRNRP
jgi:hypothetical protein